MKRIKESCLVALAVWAVLAPLAAADALDNCTRNYLDKYSVPGAVIAIVREGCLQTLRAYGLSNLETETPMTPDAVFEIASLTKPLTASAVMLLVQQGRVKLDDPISAYLPSVPAAWGGLRVRHLLSHTAGLAEELVPDCQGAPLLDVPESLQFDLIARTPLLFEPGQGAQYSDPGYFLLGMIIEKVSGLAYANFMDSYVFRRLQMANSRILDQASIIKKRVPDYTLQSGKLRNGRRVWQPELASHFGVMSTVEDLSKFDLALSGHDFLSASSLEQMTTPAKLNSGRWALVNGRPYGLGWELVDYRGIKAQEHGGFSGTHMLRFPDLGLTVIVLTNLDLASGNMPNLLARDLAGLTDPRCAPPHLIPVEKDRHPDRTQTHLELLRTADMSKAWVTPEFSDYIAHMPPPLRQRHLRIANSLKTFRFIAEDLIPGTLLRLGTPVQRILHYKGSDAKDTYYYSLWIDAAGRVADVRFTVE